MSVRCFQILLAEAGRCRFLIVLQGPITVVLIASIRQRKQHEAGSHGQGGGEAHFSRIVFVKVWVQQQM